MISALTLPIYRLAKPLLLGTCCYLLLGATSCLGLDVLRIEEHWELHVGGPDTDRCAPQVTMVMAPTANLNGDFFIFTLNHWSRPDFASGGLEVQRWSGDNWVSSHHGSNKSSMGIDGEIVTWTQSLELTGSQLSFTISDGDSQTWGHFGGQGLLRTSFPTELTRLNDYLPATSFSGSGISYAGNRVSSLTLTKLVWWTSDGVEHEKVAPIDIDTDLDP